ncbi:MFS transporter [Leifsonia kafniensis]|uniref:MFS transporter n=2 Tax=Leifsonia kafniensis TaxID=475957 RepID=A0ABP7KS89_9MICO
MAAGTLGLVGRSLANDELTILGSTLGLFAALGVANILLPALVKKYFPDRIGLLTAAFTVAMALSTMLPAALAVPVADAANWRFSMGMWAIFAAAAVIPWIILIVRSRRAAHPSPAEGSPTPIDTRAFGRLWRLPLAWALTLVFATAGGIAYSTFAWIPAILGDTVGFSPAAGGVMLALFALVAVVTSVLAPIIMTRSNRVLPLFLVSLACGFIGVAGLIWVPAWNTWLWIVLLNLATTTFPMTMMLLGMRVRSAETAVALSGFVQSIGYLIAALFPIGFGILHDLTGSWTPALALWMLLLAAALPAGFVVARPITIEAQWERHTGRQW